MTNKEKFIEIMNATFDMKMTPENLDTQCTPHGVFLDDMLVCARCDCEDCRKWWDEEYKQP